MEETKTLQTTTTLSVVLAAWNEAATVGTIIDQILALSIRGVEIELIIVESNSSDGTREIVATYESRPRVKIVYQQQARGKGNAVREGLAHATGEIVLIQDADLEYRVDEYPLVLAPIIRGEANFVLGNRHVPGRPIRQFNDHHIEITSRIVNAAHWILTMIFNILYGTRLRDPMTMFKVFRRACLNGVHLVADRFDFDLELAGKLVRQGHRPIEVPITYQSRGYRAGKKVRFFRDPPRILWALLRFRYGRLKQAEGGEENYLSESTGPEPSLTQNPSN